MRQSKLLELLRTFSSRQLTRFREYLESPYFNRSAELQQFFDTLTRYAPDFQNPGLDKTAFREGYQSPKPLTEKRLSYLMSQLQGQAEAFLTVEAFLADPLLPAFTRVDALSAIGQPRYIGPALERATAALEAIPDRNADFYLAEYRLRALQYWHSGKEDAHPNPALQQVSDALDAFYLAEKLRYFLIMTDVEQAVQLHYDTGIASWLLQTPEALCSNDNPAVRVYLTGIRMVQHPEDNRYFLEEKSLLRQYADCFPAREQMMLYTILLNHCIRRINRFNDQQFFTEYFDINTTLLEKGLLFENGQLSPWRYINLANTGLQTGQIEWTDHFIRHYQRYLPEEYAGDVYRMAMGNYLYHQGEPGQAQLLLSQSNPANPQIAVMVRNLLIRIYYETGATELLLAYLEAYRVFLLRQALLGAQTRKQARRFVDFTRRLARIERPQANALAKLRDDLPDAAEIFHRAWLLRQIERKMAAFGLKSAP